MHKPECIVESETHKIVWDFERQTCHAVPTRRPKLKKLSGFVIPAHHRVKMKENETINRYFDYAIELKKPWNMKVMAIQMVCGLLRITPKCLEKELEIRERIKTIQNTEQLRYLEESWRSAVSQTSVKTRVKKLAKSKVIIMTVQIYSFKYSYYINNFLTYLFDPWIKLSQNWYSDSSFLQQQVNHIYLLKILCIVVCNSEQ